MAPIRNQKRKKKTEKRVHPYAPLPSPKFPVCPSLDWWDNFSRRFSGSLCGQKKLASFDTFFKFSRKTFDYICGLVEEEMINRLNCTDLRGQVLSLNDQVAIALRRLSSGESLAAIGDLLGVHMSAVSQITWRFVEAMEKKGDRHLHWPSTEEEIGKIKSRFESIRGLPNCCGAIDTTNIMFCLSSGDPSRKIWCNGKNNPCMILQAIVDPDMRFLDVFTGLPGSLSDFIVLCNSAVFDLSQEGKRLNGEKLVLAEEAELREYVVGDGEYPLLPWLLTPYQGRGLPDVKENFNLRHYETWMVAKQALKRLKETWKIIQGVMWTPDKHKLPRIILVCCLLHNIMIDQGERMQDEIPLPSRHNSENQQQKRKLSDKTVSGQRDNLAVYLSAKVPPFSLHHPLPSF